MLFKVNERFSTIGFPKSGLHLIVIVAWGRCCIVGRG